MKRVQYLHSYAPPDPAQWEAQLVQAPRHREIFFVKDGKRHAVGSMDVFERMNWKIDQVQAVSHDVLKAIPIGEPFL
jgi:hypothetical protein